MHGIEIFQIDAFTDKVFHGNPAAVCLLTDWLNDELLQAIAFENNLSETAFLIETDEGYQIRWFTPNGEISLCGHATLAAAFVLFDLDKCVDDEIYFSSLSGNFRVKKQGSMLTLDFPLLRCELFDSPGVLAALVNQPIVACGESELDYLILLESEQQVLQAQVDLNALLKLPKRGLILTAEGQDMDFYSRCFYPKHHIPEDPVTGSAHCTLADFWSNRLNKKKFKAAQGSFRKGTVQCEVVGERVHISGRCRWYLKGHLVI